MRYGTALEEEEEAGWQCCMPPRGSFGSFMPPRGRPTLVVLSLVTSSSVASLSSASFCDAAAACRSHK